MTERISLASIVLLMVLCLQGQSPYSLSKQYTIDEGLPSNECYAIVQDSLGYIWIATDRGLSRYDGYGFKNYGINEGLEELSCLQMQMDNDGDIWLRTYSNRFYKYMHRQDTIVSYAFNDRLKKEVDDFEILDFKVTLDTLYVSITEKGFIRLDQDGELHPYSPSTKRSHNSFIKLDEGVLCFYYDTYSERFTFYTGFTREKALYHNNQLYDIRYRSNQKKYLKFAGFQAPDHRVLYYNTGHIYECTSEEIVDIFESEPIESMLFLSNGSILTGEINGGGIKYFRSFKEFKLNLFDSVFPDISISNMLIDQDDNLIVSTLEEGLLLFKIPEVIPVKSSKLEGQEITNVQGVNTSNLALNINQQNVFDYNLRNDQVSRISNIEYEALFQVYHNFGTGYRYYCAYPTSYLEYEDTHLRLSRKSNLQDGIIGKKARSLPDNETLVLSSVGIHIFKNKEHYPIYETYPTITRLDAIDALNYRDGYLIGGRDGLYYLEGYVKTKLDSIHPFFNYRINSIQRIDTTYYLGSLGGGLAIWDGNDQVHVINEEDGLISNNIEQVVTDNSNTLVLCTKYGMSRVTLTDSLRIDNYTKNHGLPSNQVNDALFINDTLIIGTSKGLAYMPKLSQKSIPPKQPIIESFKVNTNEAQKLDSLDLSYNENAISIIYKSLDYSQVNDINYRYRLNESPWAETTNTEMNFAALKPNEYLFEVSASNMDREWGSASKVNFKISKPWWETNLFFVLLGLCIVSIAYSIYKSRIRVIENKTTLEKEIRNLERAALQAQMNPHFIFNCLSSIQSFIITNEKEKAMDYLSTFAKLIRQNLNASTSDTISLDLEIKMLSNYIQLEQLRCNHSFNYEIQIPDQIDPLSIHIPPLLIQPYVENAIIHGMKSRTSGGMITVSFEQDESPNLKVIIKDNGSGMEVNAIKGKQSLGMKLTQRRLALNNMKSDRYNISTTTGHSGTEIKIEIKLG